MKNTIEALQKDNTKLAYAVMAVVLIAIILAFSLVASWLWFQETLKELQPVPYDCERSFSTFSEAMAAYEAGATYLDGDNDKIPCDNLYYEQFPK